VVAAGPVALVAHSQDTILAQVEAETAMLGFARTLGSTNQQQITTDSRTSLDCH
jgi:hypothetical protein